MALKDIIIATQADLRAHADHATATFAVDSRQVEGLRSEAKNPSVCGDGRRTAEPRRRRRRAESS
jgi:hypothetical protein